MQLIIIDAEGDQAAVLAELADEMTEDPRCSFVMRGLEVEDARSTVLISAWEDVVAPEVHTGLVLSGWSARRYDAE